MDVGEYGWGLYFLQFSQKVLEAVEEVRATPRLQVAAGMAVCLVILGEPERAAEVVAEARRLYRHLDRLPRYRAEATEGDLALLSGDLTAAERIYLRSLKRFLSAGACRTAGVPEEAAGQAGPEIRPDHRDLLSWTLETLKGARLVSPAES